MWWWIGLFVVSYAIVALTAPKVEPPKAAGIDEFQAPTASEDRPIPVLFGSREIKGANIVWYGDLKVSPIKKKSGKK